MAKPSMAKPTQPPAHIGPGFRGGRRGQFRGQVDKAKNPMQTLRRLWDYFSKQKWLFFQAIGWTLTSTAVSQLAAPLIIGWLINDLVDPTPGNKLVLYLLYLLGIHSLSSFSTWRSGSIMVTVSQNIIKRLRFDLFSNWQYIPIRYFDTVSHGDVMSRATNDMENINNTLSTFVTQMVNSIAVILGTLILMLWISPLLTIISLAVVPVMFLVTFLIAKATKKYFTQTQAKLGQLNGLIEETITGQKIVKLYTREQIITEEFFEMNEALCKYSTKAQIFSGLIGPFMNVLNNVSYGLIAGAGGWMVLTGRIELGFIVTFVMYARQFTRPVNEMANQFNQIQSMIAGAERVFSLMYEPKESPDIENAVTLSSPEGDVKFDRVSFGYEEEKIVLQKVSFHAKPGQTIALVGPTGAGKTTIVNLLTRFYEVNQGKISIDDLPIQNITRNSLRSSLGIVLQDTHLFSENVLENIRFGKLTASDEQVIEAAKMANAHQFILKLPHGYETVLSEDGTNLSQGQRQLISIARAILADPLILILDEATSNVDTRTEVHIQEAMKRLMKNRTSLVIAHRLSTIKDADIILVIHQGEIIEQGTHQSLLDQKGFYWQLVLHPETLLEST
ncbi:ABC transporter ATP-binding protein/permease [bacterium]|nr:ABC transporter ATP-binding protein/permease [bacterium]